jgi:ketopantoate reductase
MRITVLGSGGIGGYYGALLAKAGHDVRLSFYVTMVTTRHITEPCLVD